MPTCERRGAGKSHGRLHKHENGQLKRWRFRSIVDARTHTTVGHCAPGVTISIDPARLRGARHAYLWAP